MNHTPLLFDETLIVNEAQVYSLQVYYVKCRLANIILPFLFYFYYITNFIIIPFFIIM